MLWIARFNRYLLLIFAVCFTTSCSVTVTEQMIVSPSTDIDRENLNILIDELGYQESFIGSSNARLHTLSLYRDNSQPTVVVLHGNALNLTLQPWFGLLKSLADFNYNVVAIDYRGFGLSDGEASFTAMREDAQTLLQSLPYDNDLIIYGLSLGSVMAVDLGSDNRVKALILEGGVTSEVEMIDVFKARNTLGRLASVRVDEKIQFNNIQGIERLNKPILVIHGEEDKNIPIEMGEQLFLASDHSDSQFYRVQNGGHADTFHVDDEEFKRIVKKFINRLEEADNE